MKYPVAVQLDACRLCQSADLETVLDFGEPCISDFVDPGVQGTRAPLHVVRCVGCGLVQLEHTVDRDLLYADRYWYRSGTNESMVAALAEIANIGGDALKAGDRVLDIGANDGTLLSLYPDRVRKVAIEPSGLAADGLDNHADEIVRDFWPTPIDGKFQRITSIACFYDSEDPHAFVEGIKQALAPDGLWIVQMQDAESILRQNAVDYFCHEHLTLWDARQFENLCWRHGLRIARIQPNAVNGGSLRFVVTHTKHIAAGQWQWAVEPEDAERWKGFADRAQELRDRGVGRLEDIRWGFPPGLIAGIAASTKANTLLQWYEIGPVLMQAIIERAPEKIGKVTVGSNIPIISEEEATAMHPDYYVALAWHFLDGFRRRYPDVPFLTLLPAVKTYLALSEVVDPAYLTA